MSLSSSPSMESGIYPPKAGHPGSRSKHVPGYWEGITRLYPSPTWLIATLVVFDIGINRSDNINCSYDNRGYRFSTMASEIVYTSNRRCRSEDPQVIVHLSHPWIRPHLSPIWRLGVGRERKHREATGFTSTQGDNSFHQSFLLSNWTRSNIDNDLACSVIPKYLLEPVAVLTVATRRVKNNWGTCSLPGLSPI